MASILRKSNVLMIPPQSGDSKNMLSTDQIAQAVTTYKHIMGDQNTGALFEGGKNPNDQTLSKIIAELQDIKD